jgi:hypothetical protein
VYRQQFGGSCPFALHVGQLLCNIKLTLSIISAVNSGPIVEDHRDSNCGRRAIRVAAICADTVSEDGVHQRGVLKIKVSRVPKPEVCVHHTFKGVPEESIVTRYPCKVDQTDHFWVFPVEDTVSVDVNAIHTWH